MALAFGGLLYISGYPDRPPVRPGTWLADYQTALYGAFAVLIALYHRDARGGSGQQIDLALYETVFRFTDILVAAYDKLGMRRERQGNASFAAAPGEHFQTADGRYIVLTVSSNPMFRRLCSAMNRLDLVEDERFSTHDARYANLAGINDLVAAWVKSCSFETLRETLEQHGVAFSLVYSVEDIIADPHYAARENIVTVDNPRTGPIRMQSVVPRLCGTPGPPITAAPSLGANNDEVYKGLLGLSDADVQGLKAAGAI
jgi:crotonobetainyl-CoA:carnitine CoA-transferase CaiB-like acyl-CoA transferase